MRHYPNYRQYLIESLDEIPEGFWLTSRFLDQHCEAVDEQINASSGPTTATPGSIEKIEELRRRWCNLEPLWHDDDNSQQPVKPYFRLMKYWKGLKERDERKEKRRQAKDRRRRAATGSNRKATRATKKPRQLELPPFSDDGGETD